MKERVVFSTEQGKMCPECQRAVAACVCRKGAVLPTGGAVRVARETKGRQGKSVTVVRGLPLEPLALAQLGKTLRTACGSGGTVKEGVIEIQGDHVELVLASLLKQGWSAKRGGG
ncbi:MAG: translation initiation factor Sui1 [Magnetococcales bacterium]|nr:translation initiation factor Sui1 [Magnetococcales bacterium]MBF0114314.1 translation initiation factor Sui1 [Magnetococcales bacterium]